MQTALILGSTRATIKHESFQGQRLVLLQPLMLDKTSDGPPLIAIDAFGSRRGDHVIITSDGMYARSVTNHKNTPARWSVMGILD
jgi:ethanolamine utilization protein EutN